MHPRGPNLGKIPLVLSTSPALLTIPHPATVVGILVIP